MVLTGLVMMIVVTLLYGSELGAGTVLKYWGVFMLVFGLNMFVLHIPTIAALLQFSVAAAMYIKARFDPALD